MEIRFAQSQHQTRSFAPAVLLAAVVCSVFAALDLLSLLPAALAGVLIPVVYSLFRQKKPVFFYILFGILAAFLLIRFVSVTDGVKLLINQMFSRSQMQQSYEYDYFETFGENPREAVLFLSLLAGTLCALWRGWFTGILTVVWILAMAYFGVTPGVGWLTLLCAAGLLNALPEQQQWFLGGGVLLVLVIIALLVRAVAPGPNTSLSAWDDKVRDELALHSVFYEQMLLPTEIPEPETQPTEPPPVEEEQPDHGVEASPFNILFLVLSVITALLLFSQAIVKDLAEKRRQKNRAGLNNPDNAAAICAIYLYAQRWRKLADTPMPVPEQVWAIWLEAAYSEHSMTDAQRQAVHDDMKQTAAAVWEAANWKKRLTIRYRIAL